MQQKFFSSLIKFGADINIKNRNNQTILEHSLIHKHYIVTKIIFNYLIENFKSKDENKNENEFKNSNKFHKVTTIVIDNDNKDNKYIDNNYIIIYDDDDDDDNNTECNLRSNKRKMIENHEGN
eukprot:jgi/Orpsp1_1/1178548/evm.model.c7180000065794.1